MKHLRWMILVGIALLLVGCGPRSARVTMLADDQVITLDTVQRLPSDILTEAGIFLAPEDRVLYLGSSVPLDAPLPDGNEMTLVVRRAVTLTVASPGGEPYPIITSAQTVGEALVEAGLEVYAADRLDPPFDTPLTGDTSIYWEPASKLTITADGVQVQVKSSASTVGRALAGAGIALIGMDYSLPPEDEPLPADGRIRVVRVVENVSLTTKSIPYGTRTELSADLEIDQQALIQGGESGLAVTRLRTRIEDGVQVSQVSESETIVRPPQDQILGIGTKIVIRTTVVDGVEIEYWRAFTVFSTCYVPCGPSQPRCYYGTASGTLVRKGAIAMVYPWYLLFAGEHVYVPGYGFGIIEDNNGALTNTLGQTYWIDLGFSQEEGCNWSNRDVTLYFLTPVAANVADTYILP